ncbi:hypothetical protein AVEN_28589-1 [Araneus ventricosus]|uniref:Uncharacterized protein n=1 Tax=Araneus ventricosus TaxID=182803 RepID=A0A4Y2DDW6_ARAVE|nr:hypothetical protein AVEN_28589-1 [Araneus ventricosus]
MREVAHCLTNSRGVGRRLHRISNDGQNGLFFVVVFEFLRDPEDNGSIPISTFLLNRHHGGPAPLSMGSTPGDHITNFCGCFFKYLNKKRFCAAISTEAWKNSTYLGRIEVSPCTFRKPPDDNFSTSSNPQDHNSDRCYIRSTSIDERRQIIAGARSKYARYSGRCPANHSNNLSTKSGDVRHHTTKDVHDSNCWGRTNKCVTMRFPLLPTHSSSRRNTNNNNHHVVVLS